MEPFRGDFAVFQLNRPKVGAGVVASRKYGARKGVGAVEISHAGKVALAAVAVVVTPETLLRIGGRTAEGAGAVRVVKHRVDGFAGLTIESGQVFRTTQDMTARSAVVSCVACVLDGGHIAGLVHVGTCAVLAARGRLAHQLSLSVAVEVIHHILRVVGAGADVLTQIHAPQLLAVELVAVDIHVARVAALAVVLGVARIPFHEQLILAVAINIANRAVVRSVAVVAACVRARCRAVQFQRHVERAPRTYFIRAVQLFAATLCHHLKAVGGCHPGQGLEGCAVDVLIKHLTVLQQVEHHVVGVGAQQTPAGGTAAHTACGGRNHHQSAVQFLHLAFGGHLSTGGRSCGQQE